MTRLLPLNPQLRQAFGSQHQHPPCCPICRARGCVHLLFLHCPHSPPHTHLIHPGSRGSPPDSTRPSPWRSSVGKAGHVPHPSRRARAPLELHPPWFQTQGQFLALPLSTMISLFSRRLGGGPGPRGSPKHTNAEICMQAPNSLLNQDSSKSRFPTDE